jgi:hypothetical protein
LANGITAIFMATAQGVANVAESSAAFAYADRRSRFRARTETGDVARRRARPGGTASREAPLRGASP